MAGTQIPPSMTHVSACPTHHRPADNRSCQPLPASHPGNPAADPVLIQSGRNSGPLILGIFTLH
ncbi:hypothetical protein TH24_07690 [Thalassospira xiamenensis]|nr:hypothetical protein TH24_07690 [Thalassospira xiamenensis]